MRIVVFVSIIVLSLGSVQTVWGEQISAYAPLANVSKDPLIKVAKEQEEQFVRRGIRFNDPELQEILNRVADAVVLIVADKFIDYRVYLIRDPSPLAFSLADGQIYVHTGLLARLENEAQLAAVLAHEAHHVAAHHHIQANNLRRTKGKVAGGIVALLNRNSAENVSYESNLDHIAQTSFQTRWNLRPMMAVSLSSIGPAIRGLLPCRHWRV